MPPTPGSLQQIWGDALMGVGAAGVGTPVGMKSIHKQDGMGSMRHSQDLLAALNGASTPGTIMSRAKSAEGSRPASMEVPPVAST